MLKQKRYEMMNFNSLMWRERITRALSLLGFIGVLVTAAQGLNGIVGAVVMIALLDAIIILSGWLWKQIQRFLPRT